MKIRVLVVLMLFTIFMTIAMSVEDIHVSAKERKDIVGRFSKSVSRTRATDNINRSFEWMIRCVNILGQLDNFISDRTKNVIRKLHTVYNEDDTDT